ncbi:MAG: carboxypeptidase regulatory-like domain-containing protein [Blastocatellia bacterium]|nr:carboxypeptidase regulatory-like domain-containing protein [Blastocatellia bacterium]
MRNTVIVFLLLMSTMAYGAPGDLDLTFGVRGGFATTDLGALQLDERSFDTAIQSDGKIVVVGYRESETLPSFREHLVVRFNADGSLDTTFSGDGWFTIADVGQLGTSYAVVIQPDGKIVVGGGAGIGSSTAFIFRLEPDGDPDTTFSGDGVQTVIATGCVLSMALASDGKIIASTYYNGGAFPSGYLTYVLRLNSDGTLDNTFDSDGKRLINDVLSQTVHYPYGTALQSDGKIVVAGQTGSNTTFYDLAMVRLETNGSFDLSFDGDGVVRTQLATQETTARSVIVQSDGKIVVSGGISQPSTTFVDPGLFRYESNGSLDTSFDGDGYRIYEVIANNEDFFFDDIVRQADGKYLAIASGVSSYPFFNKDDHWIVRANSDGSPDNTFDANSVVKSQWCETGKAIAVHTDGSVIAAGSRDRVNDPDYEHGLCVQRFTSAGAVDYSFASSPSNGKATIGAFGLKSIYDVAYQLSGKMLVAGVGTSSAGLDAAIVARINSDGTLDTTFMDEGIYMRSDPSSNAAFYDIKVLSDGGFYLAGQSNSSTAMIVKFTGGAVPDTSFSGDGVATTTNAARFNAVAVQSDGKPIGCGSLGTTTRNGRVVRFTTTGTAEVTTTNSMGSPGFDNDILECGFQSDGKLVVVGYGRDNVLSSDRVAVSRHSTSLAIDSTFGTSGISTVDLSPFVDDRGRDIAIQTDDKILVASTGFNGTNFDMAAIRFDANGTPDPSFTADFGAGGVSLIDFLLGTANDTGSAILLQPDGQILVGGTQDNGTNLRFGLAKLNPGGGIAIGFGTLGRALAVFAGANATVNSMAFYSNNRIVMAGQVFDGPDPALALARFQNEFIPTAAGVTISGQVLDPDRNGIANAVVTIEGTNGSRSTVRTSTFGYFSFEGIAAGQSYVVSVGSKRFGFEPRLISVTEDILGMEIIATNVGARGL